MTEAVEYVHAFGGWVAAVFCFLNRSLKVDKLLAVGDLRVPVVALVRKPILQYEQDDPAVAADIAAGNVIWKPKNEWTKLEEAMSRHQHDQQGDDGP